MDLVGGLNLVAVILGFGFLILMHELGHYLAARWAGIRVDNFAIGMGPVLCSWRRGIGAQLGSSQAALCARFNAPSTALIPESTLAQAGLGETEWTLRLLPLGGFVRMLGQDDGALSPEEAQGNHPRSYANASVGRRMVVISGGVVMNIAVGLVFFVIAFLVGVHAEAPVMGAVAAGSPAASAGIRPGDRIVSIDGSPTPTFTDVALGGALHTGGTPLTLEVERDGTLLSLKAMPQYEAADGMQRLGVAPAEGLTLTTDRSAVPLLHQALVGAGCFDPARVHGAPPGWFECRDDRSAFERSWRGGVLRTIQGTPDESFASLQQACAAGTIVPTVWSIAWGDAVHEVAIALAPLASMEPLVVEPAGGPAELEFGLAGLVPLTLIRDVLPGSPSEGLLQRGDVILSAGDVSGPRMSEFRSLVGRRAGAAMPLVVLRNGERVAVEARVDGSGRIGVLLGPALDRAMIAGPIESVTDETGAVRTPASGRGLLPCTTILEIAGQPVHDWASIRSALKGALGTGETTVPMLVRFPGGQDAAVDLSFTPPSAQALLALGWVSPIGPEWFEPLMVTISADGNPLRAVAMGLSETRKLAIVTWLTIDRLVRGTVAVKQLRGPVGIVQIGTQVADRGWTYLVFFLAVISVNLAVLNFLPLPIADGGHMCYLLYERVTGHPPSVLFQNVAVVVGLLLFGALFLITFFNDISRLVVG